MSAIVDEIFDLFSHFGSGRYGEDLSLEEHMLQSAAMAQSLGAPRHVVVAALLHDIGYFLHPGSETSIDQGRNLEHEALGSAWLSRAFNEEITSPIAFHVRAKRYLCAVEPEYFDRLSGASRKSLSIQGGIMNDEEIAAFMNERAFHDALILRHCDDLGKSMSAKTPTLKDYRELLVSSLR